MLRLKTQTFGDVIKGSRELKKERKRERGKKGKQRKMGEGLWAAARGRKMGILASFQYVFLPSFMLF